MEEHVQWKSCCFTVDKDSVRYFTQVAVLVSTGLFSACMLVINEDCNSQRNYSAILMMCLGVFVPAPRIG